jgi:5'-nucleotidase
MTDPIPALVTNDDGIDSEGLWQLAALARDCGLTPVVAAPLADSSGSSAGLTSVGSDGRVVTERRTIPGLDGVPAHAVRALPGYIVLLSTQGAFGPAPRVVLSGVNRGPNTGNAVLHSGTVGAALTACTYGIPAVAVSLAADETSDPLHWRTAAELAGRVLPWVLDADQPMVLNLNVPNAPVAAVRGLRRARLARFGVVQTTVSEVGQGSVEVTMADREAEHEPDTDAALLADGYATVTPLRPICEATEIPLPAD